MLSLNKNIVIPFVLMVASSLTNAELVFAEVNTKSLILQIFNTTTLESTNCEGNAKVARLYFKDGSGILNGCWVPSENGIQIAWLYGDLSIVPYNLFKKPIEANSK
jgi:hypothetical protein